MFEGTWILTANEMVKAFGGDQQFFSTPWLNHLLALKRQCYCLFIHSFIHLSLIANYALWPVILGHCFAPIDFAKTAPSFAKASKSDKGDSVEC